MHIDTVIEFRTGGKRYRARATQIKRAGDAGSFPGPTYDEVVEIEVSGDNGVWDTAMRIDTVDMHAFATAMHNLVKNAASNLPLGEVKRERR
jgi:hypothetical protein